MLSDKAARGASSLATRSQNNAVRSALFPWWLLVLLQSRRGGNSMANLSGVVQMLKNEQGRLTKELQGISAALAAFGKTYGRPTGTRRRISAAGRARIVAAQKARWARVKASKNQGGPQEDGSRATCSMGQCESGKEGSVDVLTRNGELMYRRAARFASPAEASRVKLWVQN
jgi:hypothetical protein